MKSTSKQISRPDPARHSLAALAALMEETEGPEEGRGYTVPAAWGPEDDMTPLAWWERLVFWGTVLIVGGAFLWGTLRWLWKGAGL